MFKKLIICLTQPRQIGLYTLEKIRYSVLFLAVLLVVALIPSAITMSLGTTNISDEAVEFIEDAFMHQGNDYPLSIQNGLLEGEKALNIGTNHLIILINPNAEDNPFKNYSMTIPTIEFKANEVVGYVGNTAFFTKTYLELQFDNFDFNAIMNHDFVAFHQLITQLDSLMTEFKAFSIGFNFISMYMQMFSMLIISSALLGLIAKLFHQLLPYRLRFKVALDCQIISLFGILLASLFNNYYIMLFGLFLSSVYLIKALKSIIRVEVKHTPKDGEK